MDKKNIINFFDKASAFWDEDTIRNEAVISKILDGAEIREGARLLDVACGTGVLIPDYLARGVESVTAIDFSPKMVSLAKDKFSLYNNVEIICADAYEFKTQDKFDCIMVHNSFPHFPYPEKLVEHLSSLLKKGGVLTIAHSMSKEELDTLHKKSAGAVSIPLLSTDELADIFSKRFNITVKISDNDMYQVSGKLK